MTAALLICEASFDVLTFTATAGPSFRCMGEPEPVSGRDKPPDL
jgi:hypothetical protein